MAYILCFSKQKKYFQKIGPTLSLVKTVSVTDDHSPAMFVIKVCVRGTERFSYMTDEYKETQRIAMEWSKNKYQWLGEKLPFHDFNVLVYDFSKPATSQEQDIPSIYF
jgi:hypothetical protein